MHESSPHPKLNKHHHYCQCHLMQAFLVDPICEYAQNYLIISHVCTCLIFWIILSIVQIIGQLFCQKNMRKGHCMHNNTHACMHINFGTRYCNRNWNLLQLVQTLPIRTVCSNSSPETRSKVHYNIHTMT